MIHEELLNDPSKTTVFVVMYDIDYSNYEIEGAFYIKEDAIAFIKASSKTEDSYLIQEVEVQ